MRLTIVSSYDEVCGNATYAEALRGLLHPHFKQVTVTGLNTFLLRNRSAAFKDARNDHIRQLSREISTYDHVNFQIELSLYGSTPKSALWTIMQLLGATRDASLTMHRIDLPRDNKGWFTATLSSISSFLERSVHTSRHNQWASVYAELLLAAQKKNFRVIVHTKREAEYIGYLAPQAQVVVHPISFSTPAEISNVRGRAQSLNAQLKQRLALNDDSVLLGVFGFISNYKMIEVAVESLKFLPQHYKLVIVGGVHPHAIEANEIINPYVSKIWRTIHSPLSDQNIQTNASFLMQIVGSIAGRWSVPSDPGLSNLAQALSEAAHQFRKELRDEALTSRVHFVGHATDPEMNELIAACDFSVLPYMETGQSGSGIAALSMEFAQRIVTSKNLAFLELARFAPLAFSMSDIGFAKGLADAIITYRTAVHSVAQRRYQDSFNGITNAAAYVAASRPI